MPSDAWGEMKRRNARRWGRLGREIAAATGWQVWNPGLYGDAWHARFRALYPPAPHPVLSFGLNPGPYGMSQTGLPFTDLKRLVACLPALATDIAAASGEAALEVPGLAPASLRPYLTRGFESSSVRVYRFLAHAHGDAEEGVRRFVFVNPCSLLFMDRAERRNRTPADLVRAARAHGSADARALLDQVDRLRWRCAEDALELFAPRAVVLLGRDVQGALGERLRERGVTVLDWEHPARAVPDPWARGLARELRAASAL